MKRRFLLLFALVAAAQILVPVHMIRRHEETLRQGERFLFECAPVHPADALSGRYLALDFVAEHVPTGEVGFVARESACAGIVVGEDGFARLAPLLHRAPEQGPYLRVRLRSIPREQATTSVGDTVTVQLPFDRYYLNEDLAKQVEAAFPGRTREDREQAEGDRETLAQVAVRVQDGYPVIEELYLDGRPLGEYLDSL